MERYRDIDRDSNVVAYETGPDYIRVQFAGGATYLYTYSRPGREQVERMKELARSGEGLNSYINRQVGSRYERRER